jgi:hypothetical protein
MVLLWHRHHRPAQGHRFSIGVEGDDGMPHGAAIVGRPVARVIDSTRVCEVTRLVTDGTPHAASMLYAACARAAAAMGFDKIQTYILDTEPGTSLRPQDGSANATTRAAGIGFTRTVADDATISRRERNSDGSKCCACCILPSYARRPRHRLPRRMMGR